MDEDGNPIEQKKGGGGAAESADDDLARAGMGGNDNKVTSIVAGFHSVFCMHERHLAAVSPPLPRTDRVLLSHISSHAHHPSKITALNITTKRKSLAFSTRTTLGEGTSGGGERASGSEREGDEGEGKEQAAAGRREKEEGGRELRALHSSALTNHHRHHQPQPQQPGEGQATCRKEGTQAEVIRRPSAS